MKFKNNLFVLITILSFASCKPQYIKQGVRQVDSLKVSLDSIGIQLISLDSAEIKEKFSMYQESIVKVKAFDDSNFSEEEWTVMSQYGQIRKPLRNYINKLPDFFAEYEASAKQLDDLKHDLVKRYITEEQFMQYYQKEKEIIKNFSETFKIYYSSASVQLLRFDTLYPQMNVIIENHSNKE